MAANPLGEEKSPAQARGVTPARIAALAGLAIVVIALAVVLFSGGNSHNYKLVFQNAAQLVPDNQVLIGGQAVGSVESIGLTDDNLAEIEVSVDQQLHEGTTAVIRATSLSGVANHYISISPGPNSNPALDEGATLDLGSTTTEVDLDQLLNTFPNPVRRALGQFVRGNAAQFSNRGKQANQTFKYFGPALNRTTAFVGELNADQNLLERFVVSSSKLSTVVAQRGNELSSAISNASTAFGAIASRNEALDQTLRLLPPFMRQANTTFVNLRAALGDLDPLVETAKPATKNLASFLSELRPVLSKAVPVFKNFRLSASRKGFANDTAETLGFLPAVQERSAKAFPHAEQGIEAFQPTLNFARAYTPDIFNGFGKLGQITGYYDGNGHYARAQLVLNLFQRNSGSGELEPISPSEQYDAFGGSANVRRSCPGGATQPAPDGSNPFTEPPFAGSGVSPSSACNPADAPPGP
ncbi:MAG TPA: MlaD family protein [Solirubrobacterales bacterium]|nr:MlaD family protein [Solirubrobacterales bacterium]